MNADEFHNKKCVFDKVDYTYNGMKYVLYIEGSRVYEVWQLCKIEQNGVLIDKYIKVVGDDVIYGYKCVSPCIAKTNKRVMPYSSVASFILLIYFR